MAALLANSLNGYLSITGYCGRHPLRVLVAFVLAAAAGIQPGLTAGLHHGGPLL